MMLSYLATFTVALGMAATSAEAPQWHSDYGKALNVTRTEHRPLLIVIDSAEGEGRQIDQQLLEANGESKLSAYELCHVDASTEYGQKVAKAFRATTFPYVAIIDKEGDVVIHSHTGKVNEKDWNSMLVEHQAGNRVVKTTVAKPVTANYNSDTSFPSDFSYPGSTKPYCARCQRGY
jgi:hypothetical protein